MALSVSLCVVILEIEVVMQYVTVTCLQSVLMVKYIAGGQTNGFTIMSYSYIWLISKFTNSFRDSLEYVVVID